MTHALDAVIDAALERAVVGDGDARRYFALAGALERVRTDVTDAPGSPRNVGSDPDRRRTADGAPADVFGAALASITAVRALPPTSDAGIDLDAWVPGETTCDAELIVAGAAAACRRLDVGAETVAASAGIPRERLSGRRHDE